MTQMTRHAAYLLIEDQLDAVGQKYRGVRIVRGFMLWMVWAIVASFAAAGTAHYAGAGRASTITFWTWTTCLSVSAAWWILRPLLLRPRNLEVARLVETRVDGLHNGLTNSVLLARAADLQDSPWLARIFEEILLGIRSKPLAEAVSLRDLKPLLLRLAGLLAPLAGLLAIPSARAALDQGWRQMFNPRAFVPEIGAVRILDVQPREITLVMGQPLEITVLAQDPRMQTPQGLLVFEAGKLPPAALSPAPADADQLRYTYRVEHVDAPLRFRVEIAGTQSDWSQVNVVRQVKLSELGLSITPPAYTRKPPQVLLLKPDDIDKTAVSVLEGSKVQFSAAVDVPAKNALLQMDDLAPVPMSPSEGGQRFTQTAVIMQDAALAALLKEGEQIIAKVPDPSLKIACAKDAPPAIQMKWPPQDVTVAPKAELKLQAIAKDDLGLSSARVLMALGPDSPLESAYEMTFPDGATTGEISVALKVPDAARAHGQSIRVQVEVLDNRNLAALVGDGLGAPTSTRDTAFQKTSSPIFEIKFRDPEQIAQEQKAQFDQLRTLLLEMIRRQQELHGLALAWTPALKTMPRIRDGQFELRDLMQNTAETFRFEPEDKLVQKVLLVLAQNPAKDAIDLAQAIQNEPVDAEKLRQCKDLQARQRRIIDTLETLLSRLANAAAPTTQPLKNGGDLANEREKYKDLDEAMKKFIAEEKRILDATATLAKKPVDNYDSDDKKLLEELKTAQDKLDAFMQEKVSDFSKLAEQDMANASLLKELLEVYSEVTMATDALKKQSVEMAIPAEEMGTELAKSLESNLEKWLENTPDRQKWNQEDPLGKQDIPMAELPKELEDMVGELMEQQEDLFEEMEDTAANWADSLDKGAGWGAADGPIANMSAKGVTGNVLPNNNEMNGRSGEGRSGKSSGEFVEDTATGKGGRNTPTRLDPTAFQQGQIKDESKDPMGGATGGGKISGQGGAGLEGPVPKRDLRDQLGRLADKQAQLRNKVERLDLDRKLGQWDNFKLMESVAMMRRVESDLRANRYNNALRRKDILLDRLDESHLLLNGQIHLQRDTSPKMSMKMEEQLNDVTNGQLPPAWSEALKEYYRKLSAGPAAQ